MTQGGVVIIGGGLAGLCAARLLRDAAVGFELLEARDRLGGRILSSDEHGKPTEDGFDLGASWFWPRAQGDLARLIAGLGLGAFPQDFGGDIVVERMSRETPQRYRPLQQEPQSMRLVGGTGALVAALARDLPTGCLGLGRRVTRLTLGKRDVDVSVEMPDGAVRTSSAEAVIAAVPPRLFAETVALEPPCDPAVARKWRATGTWMAPHAKFVAVYDRPFWREAGLSGTAQSFVGPMAEIHDATTASGRAALLGFLAVGADTRASLGQEALSEACTAQLARLFGPEAGRPRRTLVKDWAAEPLTATGDDRSAGTHPNPGDGAWVDDHWAGRLILAGSETSSFEPGFMAGAVASGQAAATAALAFVSGTSPTRACVPDRGLDRSGTRVGSQPTPSSDRRPGGSDGRCCPTGPSFRRGRRSSASERVASSASTAGPSADGVAGRDEDVMADVVRSGEAVDADGSVHEDLLPQRRVRSPARKQVEVGDVVLSAEGLDHVDRLVGGTAATDPSATERIFLTLLRSSRPIDTSLL